MQNQLNLHTFVSIIFRSFLDNPFVLSYDSSESLATDIKMHTATSTH